jgi:hypothetical protein
VPRWPVPRERSRTGPLKQWFTLVNCFDSVSFWAQSANTSSLAGTFTSDINNADFAEADSYDPTYPPDHPTDPGQYAIPPWGDGDAVGTPPDTVYLWGFGRSGKGSGPLETYTTGHPGLQPVV